MNLITNLLNELPRAGFEFVGMFIGGFACLMILVQIVRELRLAARSSISLISAFGWALIFGFWMLYGLRLDAQAIFYSNIIATILQLILTVIISVKNRRYR